MELSKDGDYFFDVKLQDKFEEETYKTIISNLETNETYSFRRNGEEYLCEKTLKNIKISTNNKQPTELDTNKFIDFKDKCTKFVFSMKQLETCLNYYGFYFPLYDNKLLSKEQLKKLFYFDFTKKIQVTQIPLEEIYSNKIPKEIKTFQDISKYINLYIKNKNIFEDFEEKEFFNEKDYEIDVNSEFEFYGIAKKKEFWNSFDSLVKLDDREFFFTGPHGIGKTFILLTYLYKKHKEIKPVYFNLEILYNANNYFEIIAYESRRLFSNIEEFKVFFEILKECGNNQSIFGIIKNIISILSGGNFINKYYTIILDQIKINDINSPEFFFIKEVRELIKKSKNVNLIGCASLDYHCVRDSLLKNTNSEENSENLPPFIYFSKIYDKPDKIINNNYLPLLGYLPRFIQLSSKINKKIVNVLKKKIKKKIKKYYNFKNEKNNFISSKIISDLEKISEIAGKTDNKFYNYLRAFPIKFLSLDFKSCKIDYLYPLVEITFKEYMNTLKIENSYDFGNNQELGWQFEHRVLDKFISSNKFFNYYIDSIIEIPTIFKKYPKLKNFVKTENTLFTFKFSNVKRYDSAIYLANEEIFVLLQISIHKTKKQIEQYTHANFRYDLYKINKNFLKVNKIKPKKFYLLFILDKENYEKTDYQDVFIKEKFQFVLFDTSRNDFQMDYPMDKFSLEYQINISYNDIDNNNEIMNNDDETNIVIFKKRNRFEISNINEKNIYYIDKSTSLEEFFDEIINDDELKNSVPKNYNMKKYYFEKYAYNDYKRMDSLNFNIKRNSVAFCLYYYTLFLGIEEKDRRTRYFHWVRFGKEKLTDPYMELSAEKLICFIFQSQEIID